MGTYMEVAVWITVNGSENTNDSEGKSNF